MQQPGGLGEIYLVEPRALQDEHAATKELQDNVVSQEHLQHGAGRPAEHGHQQQGVNVCVQRRPAVHVVIEQEPWEDTARVRETPSGRGNQNTVCASPSTKRAMERVSWCTPTGTSLDAVLTSRTIP